MTESIVYCPNCNKAVDEAFYYKHVMDAEHKIGVVDIKGVGTQLVMPLPGQHPNSQQPSMVDIPYLGRLRRDGFLAWSFIMLLAGVLLAGYAWRII